MDIKIKVISIVNLKNSINSHQQNGESLKRSEEIIFRVAAIVLVYVGAVSQADLGWNMADMAQGLMVITNAVELYLSGDG